MTKITKLLGIIAVVSACATSTEPGNRNPPNDSIPEGALRVLFIGNSLTYTDDLPLVVAAMADSAGQRPLYARTWAFPDVSLEDHWGDGKAQDEIIDNRWDIVVLQQGPSAAADSRVLLLDYAKRFGQLISSHGARPAMYAPWPSMQRPGDFSRSYESYRLAAEAIGGMLFPAGSAWVAAWDRDSSLPLYGDALHASTTGTYLTALVIFQGLYGVSPVGLPRRVRTSRGAIIGVTASEAALLQDAAAQTNAAAMIR